MKRVHFKDRLVWLDLVVAAATIGLVGAGIWFGIARKDTHDVACTSVGTEHQLSVSDDAFSVDRLILVRCDTIKIRNVGPENYMFAFGEHDHHIPYPGVAVQPLGPGEFFVINAVQAGIYTLHDHLRDKARVDLDIRAQERTP